MTTAEARRLIERHSQWNVGKGQLTTAEVDDLLLLARVPDVDENEPDDYAAWVASTVYALDAEAVPIVRNGYYFTVTTAGTSGATEPTWPTTIGATVADGTVVWTNAGVAAWLGAYDVREAAAMGWTWRAGKLNAEFKVAVGSGRVFERQWTPEFCLRMAAVLRGADSTSGGGMVSVPVRSGSYAG